jgi:PII-like signaling protein
MNARLLRFHVPEGHRHAGVLLWEWLLHQAAEIGAPGGSVLRPIADFGRHHVLHEQKFFELAGNLTVQVELLLTDEQHGKLMERVTHAGLRLPYTRFPVEIGIINPDTEDTAVP